VSGLDTAMSNQSSHSSQASVIRPRGNPLSSLANSAFASRFYSWRGASGLNYVSTVFADSDRATMAEFRGGAIIGVAHHGDVRRPVCVFGPADFRSLDTGPVLRAVAELGVNEWHMHFASDPEPLSRDLNLCPHS
jgi:hypothetical protein